MVLDILIAAVGGPARALLIWFNPVRLPPTVERKHNGTYELMQISRMRLTVINFCLNLALKGEENQLMQIQY